MVSETLSKNGFDFMKSMESYRLLELSGSESENDIIHFASNDPHPQSQAPPQPRKKRLKRKERDLLRSSGTIQYETPSKFLSCCQWCCASEFSKHVCCGYLLTNRSSGIDRWELLRSLLLVVIVICLCVVTGLAVHLHSRLDATQQIIDKMEASGSELPAKFHESHVRLQQLEKNHTSLWTSLTSVSSEVTDITQKMTKLESSLKALEDRLSGAPQLSSLPKDLANVQDSVATLGSSMQDVRSSLKALKESYTQLHKEVDSTSETISDVKEDVFHLMNETHLPPSRGREGSKGESVPLATVILSLQSDVNELSSVVAAVNTSLMTSISAKANNEDKVQNLKAEFQKSVENLSAKVESLSVAYNKTVEERFPGQIANLSVDLSKLRESFDQEFSHIQSLNESIAVVKGVEKKLEGSQLQMASKVSDFEQQLQKLEKAVKVAPSTVSPGRSNKARIKRMAIDFVEDRPDSMDSTRTKRPSP